MVAAAGVAFIALCSELGFQSPRHELGQVVESQSASKAAGCRKKNKAKIVRIKHCEGNTAKGLQKVVSCLNLYNLFNEGLVVFFFDIVSLYHVG